MVNPSAFAVLKIHDRLGFYGLLHGEIAGLRALEGLST